VNSDTQITATAPAGTGTVQVTATTVGGTSNGLAYTYVAVPVLTSVTPNRGPISAGNTVTLTGTRLTGATTVRFGAIAAVSFMVVSDTQITAVAPAGTGTVQVTATTIGGTSNGVSYTYVAAPTLTSITPNQGLAAGGNTVTLTGTGFTGATAVTFRTTPATSFTVVSDTQITAVVPGQAPASVAVTVTTPGGTSNGVIYIYLAAPTLASLSPNQGSVSGGKNVNIVGTGFTGATAVTFGSTPAASFTVISDTQIKAVTPPGNGTVQVTVTGPGGTSNARPYTYLQTPALSSISPTSGPAAGGTVVIISGDRLSTATEVDFGTRTATSFTVNSNTQITAVAPAGTGTVQVTVITLGGTSNGISYTYV
jgi:hypothetical protein